jgi:hypothetical protein
VQESKLRHDQKQEEDAGSARIQKVLQYVQSAPATQGNEVTGSRSQEAGSNILTAS